MRQHALDAPDSAETRRHAVTTFPVDVALFLACARDRVADREAIRAALEGIADWDRLVDAADVHGVAPLLHRTLERFCPDAVPPEVSARLRASYRASGRDGLLRSATLLDVHDTLRSAGVDALPLKGPVLAAALYPDPALRPFSDLDILVRRQQIPAALQALARDGYTLDPRLARLPVQTLLAVNNEVVVRHPHRAPLDLHWDIAPRGYPFRFDPELLWHRVRPCELDGREVPCLAPENLLLFLCVHGAKHFWSRLMWLGDIARLAGVIPDWTGATRIAADARCARPVHVGLLLAHDLLGAPVPASILERARADRAVPALARDVTLRLCRLPPVEPGFAQTAFNGRMADRPWGKVKSYAALLAPSEAELERLALPVGLVALYYPFRFMRLAAKYGMRLARAH